ncbi:hypothetical protein N7507_007204 [Penicillium longicatenatum]|nr:hypothetical protein N7507_007204 [Penicillium longicatenatum]
MVARNILLLIADDLGRDQTGCYGGNTGVTPHLDQLAASGTKFDMAFTSTASCSGSRTTIYTGLHTHQSGSYGLTHGRNGFQTLDSVETAPLLFNKLGYKTGIIGKVHVGPRDRYPWDLYAESESRNVADVADQAEAFFQEATHEQRPFFLTVGFDDPHRQISQRGGFGNVEGNYDPRLRDRIFQPHEVTVPSFLSDLPEVRQELSEYYRAIHRMDQGVGMILEALRCSHLDDNTLVLFLSDNGPPFINSKTTLYDAAIRLPFLLRVPGYLGVRINNNLVSFVDILPTFLDWAGHPGLAPESRAIKRSGRSILPILEHTEVQPGWDRVLGSHTFHEITNYWPTRYLRTTRYKYHRNVCWKLDFPFAMDLYASLSFEAMRNNPGDNADGPMVGRRSLRSYIRRLPEELYDMNSNRDEVVNLAGQPEFAELLKSMRQELEEWQRDTDDLWLWRDGVSVTRYRCSGYAREGLKIPHRFDFDVEQPGNNAGSAYDLMR